MISRLRKKPSDHVILSGAKDLFCVFQYSRCFAALSMTNSLFPPPVRSAKLWSAAACCRFCPASLLAAPACLCSTSGLRRTHGRDCPPVPNLHRGQQAWPAESGSKLPHSKATARVPAIRPPCKGTARRPLGWGKPHPYITCAGLTRPRLALFRHGMRSCEECRVLHQGAEKKGLVCPVWKPPAIPSNGVSLLKRP